MNVIDIILYNKYFFEFFNNNRSEKIKQISDTLMQNF